MLGTKKQYSILQVAKMFGKKIKFLPARKGERFSTSITNNNAFKYLGYKPKIDIRDYIKNIVKD